MPCQIRKQIQSKPSPSWKIIRDYYDITVYLHGNMTSVYLLLMLYLHIMAYGKKGVL